MFFIGFSILSYTIGLHTTTSTKYTICKVKPVKFIIKLYTDHNTLRVKHATHQMTESLKAASLSKLVNMVNSNFIFNIKYAEFSTKW